MFCVFWLSQILLDTLQVCPTEWLAIDGRPQDATARSGTLLYIHLDSAASLERGRIISKLCLHGLAFNHVKHVRFWVFSRIVSRFKLNELLPELSVLGI